MIETFSHFYFPFNTEKEKRTQYCKKEYIGLEVPRKVFIWIGKKAKKKLCEEGKVVWQSVINEIKAVSTQLSAYD